MYTGSSGKFSRFYKIVAVLFVTVIVIVVSLGLKETETFLPESYILNRPKPVSQTGAHVYDAYKNLTTSTTVIVRQHTAESGNQVPKKAKPYDFVINSYMRSGSSFTGQLLAFHPDTFYWYEPMWNYHSGVYYWGKDKVCSGRGVCSKASSGSGGLNVNRMHGALSMIYECNFQGLVPAVAEKMTPSYSGQVWTPYIKCRATGGNVATCLAKMEEVCRRAKHKATKIVRLTLDNLEYVLENHPNVKVVHLLRDPRAIINSRITTTWYTLSETPHDDHRAIRMDAKDLCSRMAYDLQAAVQLKQKYPDRFALVMYEDLQTDLQRKAELLYDYFGLDKTVLKVKLENMTDILPHEHLDHIKMGNHTNWWRFRLLFSSVKAVDDVCKTVCDMVGYRIFSDEEQLKNNLTSAFSFDPQLLLENIDKTNRYDFKAS